jgi:hypothetical protein
MQFKLLYLGELEEKKWEELVLNSVSSTFYHKSSWAKVWFSSFVYFTPLFFVSLDEKGDYTSGFPFILSDKYRLKRAYSMPFGTYGGLITSENLKEENLKNIYEGIENEFKKLKIVSAEITDFFRNQNILRQFGYKSAKGYTHILDLSKYPANPVHKTKRGAIQAEKKGVKIIPLPPIEKIKDCYELVKKRDKRYGLKKSKHPLGLYENIWNIFKPGRIIAFQISLLFKDTIYYWEGASEPEALHLRPNDALFKDTIQWGISKGYRYYNLGGSPKNAEGLVKFKETWGGEKKEYNIYSRKRLWYKTAEKLKRIL